MKDRIKDMWNKIFEKTLVNIVFSLWQGVLGIICSFSIFQAIKNWFIGNNLIIIRMNPLTIFYVLVALATAIWFIGIRVFRLMGKYPRFSWNFIHKHNKYILTFADRSTLEYTKIIQAKTLKDSLKEFDGGIYSWSGTNSNVHITDEKNFEFILGELTAGGQQYSVKPKEELRKNKRYDYTLSFLLEDTDHSMIPMLSIYIKRPTESVSLILNIPKNIKIKNVKYFMKTKFGEKELLDEQDGVQKSSGGAEIGTFSYEYLVKSPKLFCEYLITWQFE